jgi:polyphosphate kinase
MARNLDRRIEAVVKIEDPDARLGLIEVLALAMRDNASVWKLDGDGRWLRKHPKDGEPRIEMQTELMHHARQRA